MEKHRTPVLFLCPEDSGNKKTDSPPATQMRQDSRYGLSEGKMRAKGIEDKEIKSGANVKIIAIEGVKLVVDIA